jgi:hypothetical protein
LRRQLSKQKACLYPLCEAKVQSKSTGFLVGSGFNPKNVQISLVLTLLVWHNRNRPKTLFFPWVTDMQKKIVFILLAGLLLSGCGLRPTQEPPTPTPTMTLTATQPPPTKTPLPTPTATITPTPTPDFSVIGLPSEPTSAVVFDFVDQMCQAQWFTETGNLPCPGSEPATETGFVGDQMCEDQQSTQAGDVSCLGSKALANTAFVTRLDGQIQGLPSNIKLLLTFPPQGGDETISSKYPPFTVQAGDRFRAVLACRTYTFCDVEFTLNAFDEQGRKTRLMQWHHYFANSPIVVDYALDRMAGKTVQFDLAVQVKVNQDQAHAVWIAPHIFRPSN